MELLELLEITGNVKNFFLIMFKMLELIEQKINLCIIENILIEDL